MEIITQEQLKGLKEGQSINGIVLIKSYDTALTKSNKEYQVGTLQSGIEVGFKAWLNSAAFHELKNNDYTNCPSYIIGTVDGWGGVNNIIIESIQAVEGFTLDQFLPVKYNTEAYFEGIRNFLGSNLSEKGNILVNKVLFENEELCNRFKIEFAASSHHDNCKSGLLAHTYKVLCNINSIVNQYKGIITRQGQIDKDYMDLLFIGALLHDIGKVDEMTLGVYTAKSIVTHRYLGVEYIAPFKDLIIDSYNENWYYELISIMLQHHGQWGDPCKTVAAYIINKADELDAYMTDLVQHIEKVDNEIGQKIKFDGNYLVI